MSEVSFCTTTTEKEIGKREFCLLMLFNFDLRDRRVARFSTPVPGSRKEDKKAKKKCRAKKKVTTRTHTKVN